MSLRDIVAVFRRVVISPMMPFEFDCAGEKLQALPAGALHWPARRLLAVADLHLEKGSSYAVNARKLLPRHDTRQTLAMLTALIDVLQPRDGRVPGRFLP